MADYTILIIDYEPRSIERLRTPLERAGYRVEVATDGQSGINKFSALKPSAVIIEAMLPKRHGFEVCLELKQAPHGAVCPVMIATSVYRGRKYRHQATHQYRCDAYLEKPIADEDLISSVEAALRAYIPARQNAKDGDLAIDTTLLEEEIPGEVSAKLTPGNSTPTASNPPGPAQAASAADDDIDDAEFEILDRLDSLLSDDPSKSAPNESGD